jgi:hypothetical protein
MGLPRRVARPALLAWPGVALALAAAVAQVGLFTLGCDVPNTPAAPRLPYGVIFSLTFLLTGALGALILTYHPANRIGWIALAGGLSTHLAIFLGTYAACAAPLAAPPVRVLAAWFFGPFIGLGFATLLVFLPLLFPDGRFVSPGWRRVALAASGAIAASTALDAVWPGPLGALGIPMPFENPFSLPFASSPALAQAVDSLLPVAACLFALVANLSLIQRWRRSSGEVRQQLKWLAYYLATGGTVLLTVELLGFLVFPRLFESPLYYVEVTLIWLGLPAVLALTVFKYRLYAIDIVIRRTLIYGLVTLALALVYFGSVTVLQMLITASLGRRTPLVIVLSTLLIAALFNPVRQRVQAATDRRFYRRKYDAARTLERFALNASAEVDLETLTAGLVRIVEETVQPDRAWLWLREKDGETEKEKERG